MFKIESYITPILLSYVDKYIKNFRPEDSQVSLWGGDACFHNLDLRLEVLEEELQLPFSFVSGHVHELLFHVPWTKLASEPITITINTIECILKLRTDDQSSDDGAHSSRPTTSAKEKKRRRMGMKEELVVAPPGYVRSLVNKIVNNITIFCNNLILKYVEEDIVLSVNIKTVKVQSANEKWEPSFAELSPAQFMLRKLITLSDLTICLDKRNSSGKIEMYQEPLLYRCVMEVHLLQSYHSAKSKRASVTRMDLHCFRMDFSLTEQQIPMLMRLIMLAIALQKRELRKEKSTSVDQIVEPENDLEDEAALEVEEQEETWVGWAWSWVPNLRQTGEEDWNSDQQHAYSGHTLHLGVYVDQASVSFKVTESTLERSYYGPRKVKFVPFLVTQMNGAFMDMVMHGATWFNLQIGISSASLEPYGDCFCGVREIQPNWNSEELLYFSAGCEQKNYLLESLFDPNSIENKGQKKSYNVSWDFHLDSVTESLMLERSPAFAIDLLYLLEIPEDFSSERLSELGSDLENSNLNEQSLIRFVVGPVDIRLCSGLFHRLKMVHCAANMYDYDPYSSPKAEPAFEALTPVSTDDFEALDANIPTHTIQVTLFKPTIRLCQNDHPSFDSAIFQSHRKRRKSSRVQPLFQYENLPCLSLSCQCLDAKLVQPMYSRRLVSIVCQLPDAPQHMFDACHERLNVKLLGVISQLMAGANKQTILLPSNVSYSQRTVLFPSLWKDELLQEDKSLRAESITAVFTKPQLVLLLNIINSASDIGKASELLYNTSLLSDAFHVPGTEFLELNIEGLSVRQVYTADTRSYSMEIGTVKAFVLEAIRDTSDKHKQVQALVLSGPDMSPAEVVPVGPSSSNDKRSEKTQLPLLSCTIQGPLDPNRQHCPPVLFFSIQPVCVCVDPLLWHWLLYVPGTVPLAMSEPVPEISQVLFSAHCPPVPKRTRRVSEAGSSHRSPNPRESVHSSSDREQAPLRVEPTSPTPEREESVNRETEEDEKETVAWYSREQLLHWFPVWQGLVLSGEMGHCTIYLPTKSLSAVGTSSLEDAVSKSMSGSSSPDVLVLCFPYVTLRSASQRQGLLQYSSHLPVKLPETVWMPGKVSFPWSITLTDTSIYTIHRGKMLHFLKPCSATATVGISTKSFSNKSTLSSLGLCVHVDATPVNVAVSEEQVSLIMNIFSSLMDVMTAFSVVQRQQYKTERVMVPEPPTPVPTPTSPTMFRESSTSQESPAVKQIGTEESSERVVTVSCGNEVVKVTAWMQCTLARLSVTMYVIKVNSSPLPSDLKLTLEMEDIMTSFDVQQVYLKIKLKVASANIRHFKRFQEANKSQQDHWTPGPYLGLVMQAHEDNGGGAPSPPPHSQNHHHLHRDAEDTGTLAATANGSFLTATFTRARCGHVHSRWGTGVNRDAKTSQAPGKGPSATAQSQHKRSQKKQFVPSAATASSGENSNSRFINEIVTKLQAVDFVLSPSTLCSFMSVIQPILTARPGKTNNVPAQVVKASSTNSLWLSASSLPLVYLDTQAARVIIPASELVNMAGLHNVCVFQLDTTSLSPQVENPLSRVLVRPDIYHWAEQAGILRIPGSGVEDRQYQLDVTGLSFSTGTWHELERVLARPNASVVGTVGFNTGLRTMSENPALEWNQLQGHESIVPHVSLLPIVARADLCIVAAPAIVLDDGTLVCGHSLEVNALKDIEMSASTQQLLLFSTLSVELLGLLECLQPKEAPVDSSFKPNELSVPTDETTFVAKAAATMDVTAITTIDSGVDSVDISCTSNLPEDSVSGVSSHCTGTPLKPHILALSNVQKLKANYHASDCNFKRCSGGAFKSSLSSSTAPIGSTEEKCQSTSTMSKSVGKFNNISRDIIPIEILLTSGSWSCLFYEVVDENSKSGKQLLTHSSQEEAQENLPTMEEEQTSSSDAHIFAENEETLRSQEESQTAKCTRPLLYLQFVQPHTFISNQALTRKIQVSCFDVNVRTSGLGQLSSRDIPAIEDFNNALLETRGGDPHPGTGIPPSFLTVRWSRTLSKPPKLDVNIGRPSKFHVSQARIKQMFLVKNKLLDCIEDITLLSPKHTTNSSEVNPSQNVSPSENETKILDLQNNGGVEINFELDSSRTTVSAGITDTVEEEEDEVDSSDVGASVGVAVDDYIPLIAHGDVPSKPVPGPRDLLYGLSAVMLSTQQIVVAFMAKEEDEVGEILLSISGMNGNVTTSGTGTRGIPDRISANANIRCLTVTTKVSGIARLLLNPWSFSVEACISWEAWHPKSPLTTLTVDSDCVLVDLGPDHLRCLLMVGAEYLSLATPADPQGSTLKGSRMPYSTFVYESSSEALSSHPSQTNRGTDVDQQYRDDLRAGAFQFVETSSGSSSGHREEMPLPYQVVFTASPPTMSWRYPQPRALTRVEIFPVPFKVAGTPEGTETDNSSERVLCELQCWSEVRLRWLRVVHFELSESETRRLQLRPLMPGTAGPAARVWRVRLAAHRDDDEGESVGDPDQLPTVTVCPRTLAACMRVDSFFSPILVPYLQVSVEISKVEVSFQNHTGAILGSRPMPPPLTRFTADGLLPDTHAFAVASIGNVSFSMALWQNGKCTVDMAGLIRLDIIDYALLTQHCAVEPFRVQGQAAMAPYTTPAIDFSCVSRPISLRFGPALAHTLAVSMQLWTQALPALAQPVGMSQVQVDPCGEPQVLLTRYVVCNDTNRALRFGQASTDEDLLLSSRQCHFYSWRSQKVKRQLRVSVDDGIWAWSKSFSIDIEGVHILPLNLPEASDVLSVVVKVKALSTTQKQVTITGQLSITNILSETFECKILPETEGTIRQPQYLIAGGNSTPPSLLLSTGHNVVLRIRFQGLNSIWSGDIPLKKSPASGQPWLVKVPLVERCQFLSVWCRVFHQTVPGGTRVLAMLCPLYMIRSHLPVPAKVSIETPGLKVTMQATLTGRGTRQQLYCPGTIDHSHRLMLQLENGAPSSNQYVPLSYSMIDEQAFFKTNLDDNVDVDDLAENPTGSEESSWPFVDAGLHQDEWIASEQQPQTYVQVAYRPLGPHCASLLVDLRPWALLVNTLGVEVSMQAEDRTVCTVPSHGVTMPPRLEGTFHLLISFVESKENVVFVTPALQLARPDGSRRSFYMPKITGLIPDEGSLIVAARGPADVLCVANIMSKIIDEMRIVHIRSAYVFVNAACPNEVRVGLLAVHVKESKASYIKQLEESCPVVLPAADNSISMEPKDGAALLYWTVIGTVVSHGTETEYIDEKDFAFYVVIDVGYGWSCPLYVGGDSPSRVQFTVPCLQTEDFEEFVTDTYVLTYEEKQGQVLLTLHPEYHPQILIHNKCNFKLMCGQGNAENNGQAVPETEHLDWKCVVPAKSLAHYNLPEMARNFLTAQFLNVSSLLVFSLEHATSGEDVAMWSYGINVNEPQERFLYLPGHGDVRVSVHVHCHTAYVSVETVSHVEISARDIRARLLEHRSAVEMPHTQNELPDDSTKVKFVTNKKQDSPPMSSSTSKSEVTVGTSTSSYGSALDHFTALDEQVPDLTMANVAPPRSTFTSESHGSSFKRCCIDSQLSGQSHTRVTCFIKGFYITLLEDIPKGNTERTEVIMLSMDDVCISCEPGDMVEKNDAYKVHFLVGDLQVDNQMFQRGGFDFPVVLMGQQTASRRLRARDRYFSLSAPAQRLIEQAASHALLKVYIDMMQPRFEVHGAITATDVRIAIAPLSAYIEDTFIFYLMDFLGCFFPGSLIMASKGPQELMMAAALRRELAVRVLRDSLWRAQQLAIPLRLHSLTIEPLSVLLSVHASVKLYIALDHTPLQFTAFERKQLVTTSYRLGHALTMHYLSGALFGLGWVVGSLELLGSPSGFARTLGVGLRDFITLPYEGIFQGPWAFLVGVSHGSASLMKHITAGTLTSVTKLASSVARNLDRMTMDREHLARTEELRRHRPQGLTQGLVQGLTGFGISILGAVGGIAHHPIQSVMTDGPSTRGLVTGVGLGLVGVVTKPLSGAAELVALAGEGLLHRAGWASLPEVRHNPIIDHTFCGVNSHLKYAWKLIGSGAAGKESLVFVTEATAISPSGAYEAVALVLCTHALFLVNLEEDTTQRIVSLVEVSSFDHPSDPTLVCFQFHTENAPAPEVTSHDRVVDFVRRSTGYVHSTDYESQTEQDPPSGSYVTHQGSTTETPLTFFVNPQSRSYFLALLSLVKRQCEGKGFPIL